MCDIVVLAEHTAQVAAAEEHRSGAIVTLYARFLAEMWSNRRDFDRLSRDETVSGGFEAVDARETGTKIAIFEMGVGKISLSGD